MKKLILTLFFIITILFSFNSCNKIELNDPYKPHYPAYMWYWQPYQTYNGQWLMGGPINNYSAGQQINAQTRAYDIQQSDIMADYDDFSLFAWNKDAVVMNNYEGLIDHENYTWGYNAEKKYFDNNQTKYSFIGIIPYDTNLTLKSDKSIDVAGLEDFKTESMDLNTNKYNKEFIVASAEVEREDYSKGATLNFYHQNSIVRVKFETNDGNNLEIIDFTPYTPEQQYQPAVPGIETYTSKTTKFIDEFVAGNEVQVGIGFYGANSPKLTSTQPNPLYVGSDNTGNGWLAKTWLLSIKDAVNSQFVYYRLNQVNNSTSKTETTEDWESAASNKNIFMMKLASGVNAADFAAGNDAFMNALTAHEADWVGGSPAATFKSTFEQAYAEGWRVIRINVSDANANQVLVFLSNNQNITTQVCEVTGGTPEVPYKPASGKKGIVILPATSENQTGTDAVLSTFPTEVTANVSLNGVTYTVDNTTNEMIFTVPGTINNSVYSPTNWYTFPITHANNFGFTIKFSYTFNGVTKYDARVFIPKTKCNWQPGKWYDYVIKVNSDKYGKSDPNDVMVDPANPIIEQDFIINVNPSSTNIDTFTEGEVWNFEL